MNQTSINSNEKPLTEAELLEFVKTFEKKARQTTGQERQNLRKPEAKKPLKERVHEAIKYYERLQEKKNQ